MRDARADFHSKRRLRRVLGSPLLSVALLAIAFFIGRATWTMAMAYRDASVAQAEAEAELAELEASLEAVSRDAAALATPTGLEKQLRASLNVAAPGEEAIVIVRDRQAAAIAPAATGVWNLWGLLD
jgi:cell division protein FtsB